jgi:hypothetical protein
LETYDLIDFFIPRNDKIFPPNKIKDSIEAIHNNTIVIAKELGYVMSVR